MFNVSQALKHPGDAYPLDMRFDIEPAEIMGDAVTFTQAALKGEYMAAGDCVSIKGEITLNATSKCADCLKPTTVKVAASIDEMFAPDGDGEEAYPLVADEIDLDSVVREAVLLELPMRFLCRANCAGLCPVCGADRNYVKCLCESGFKKQNPFSALGSLLNDDNNEEV